MTQALHAPSTVRALLDKHGLRADKAFGQNFLVDVHALQSVIDAAELSSDDTVLEVGPGLGVLTRELARRAGRVIAVELDQRMLAPLAQTIGEFGNVTVEHGDAMHFPLSSLPDASKLIANLPYNIATGLIVQALESTVFTRLVVMVQKEVAERLTAHPGSEAYGAVSIIVRHFARSRIVRHVGPSSFYPPPEVTSSIVRLDVRTSAQPRPELFELVRDGFRHRRKTLAKNLQMAGYSRQLVTAALTESGIDARVRAEALSLEEFEELQLRMQAGI